MWEFLLTLIFLDTKDYKMTTAKIYDRGDEPVLES
jgi:hypothetical protein